MYVCMYKYIKKLTWLTHGQLYITNTYITVEHSIIVNTSNYT